MEVGSSFFSSRKIKQPKRAKLEEHEQAILNLRTDLEVTQAEKKNLLGQNIELSQSLATAKENIKQLNSTVTQLQVAAPQADKVESGDEISRSSGSTFSIVLDFHLITTLSGSIKLEPETVTVKV